MSCSDCENMDRGGVPYYRFKTKDNGYVNVGITDLCDKHTREVFEALRNHNIENEP